MPDASLARMLPLWVTALREPRPAGGLVEDGKLDEARAKQTRVTEDDTVERARELRGVSRMDQLKYAVLERNGGISITPKAGEGF